MGVKSREFMYHVSLKIFLSSPGHSWVHVCSNDYKEGFTKIVNFQTSGVDVFVLGGPPSHSVEMLYFFIKFLSPLMCIDQTT